MVFDLKVSLNCIQAKSTFKSNTQLSKWIVNGRLKVLKCDF